MPQVNHKDGNKLNNSVENLEWVDNLENRAHAVKTGLHLSGERATNHKLNWESIEYIRKHSEISSTELGRKFGVSRATIDDVKEYRTWKVKNDLNSSCSPFERVSE